MKPASSISAVLILAALPMARLVAGGGGDPVARIAEEPPLEVADLEGRTVVLQERVLPARNGGEATLLVLWATWCEPCLREIPEIKELQKYYEPRGLRVVSVGLREGGDTIDRLAGAAVRHDVTYPVLFDRDGAVQNAFDVRALPMSALIDRQGVVLWKGPALPRDINTRIREALMPAEEREAE